MRRIAPVIATLGQLVLFSLLLPAKASSQGYVINSPFECKEMGWVIRGGNCFPTPCINTGHPGPSTLSGRFGTTPFAHCGGFPIRPGGSIDPNDKVSSQGVAGGRFLVVEQPLEYAVFFGNLTMPPAAAPVLVITDQLDISKMNLSSFSLGPISFGETIVVPPAGASQFSRSLDLRPQRNLILLIDAGLNGSTGLATWRFTSLDPDTLQLATDPDAGFLPPNVTPPAGKGSVLFTVQPRQGIDTGTEICNHAS